MRGLSFAVFATAVLSACSATKFNSNKDFVLNKSVFGSESPGDPPPPPLPAGFPQESIQVKFICSNAQSSQSTNFMKAVAESRPVSLTLNRTVCSTDLTRIKALITAKAISTADVNALCPAALTQAGSLSSLQLSVDGKIQERSGSGISLLYDINVRDSSGIPGPDVCDQRASPLVIHLNSDPDHPRAIELSAPADGVEFDLLGRRNGHRPVKISWFTNVDYGFLTLPDARGRVRGIDELFGDNTAGPDGTFAANGYAALAKFDANRDGLIDARDAVYASLRVWIDRDFDGVARPGELRSLKRAGVETIDLKFKAFEESDNYGNSTQMKSVVQLIDGSYDLIFDLWFNVIR